MTHNHIPQMTERRQSMESRITMLEYRMNEAERVGRESSIQNAAIMEKLSDIKGDQDKLKTVVGGAAAMASGGL